MKIAGSSALEVCKLIIIDYSPNKQKMSVGLLKGKDVFVASVACQKQRISFDQLCESIAEDLTLGKTDIAAVFCDLKDIEYLRAAKQEKK